MPVLGLAGGKRKDGRPYCGERQPEVCGVRAGFQLYIGVDRPEKFNGSGLHTSVWEPADQSYIWTMAGVGVTISTELLFSLRNASRPELSFTLTSSLDTLSGSVKDHLQNSAADVRPTDDLLAKLFDVRIKAINWMASTPDLDLKELLSSAYKQITNLTTDKRFALLAENILFALRCNARVIESNLATFGSIQQYGGSFPDINYQEYLTSLSYAFPSKLTNTGQEWLKHSLFIEYVVFATDLIQKGEVLVSGTRVRKLAALVADAAQEYIALAQELGLLGEIQTPAAAITHGFSDEFVREQKAWADMGLSDYQEQLGYL